MKTDIQTQIKEIIAIRKEKRLPKIEERLGFVGQIQQRVNSLDQLLAEIKKQCAEKSGPYYSILASDPGMEIRLNNVSTENTWKALGAFQKELDRLKVRFSRNSISIQVFGMAGSGKSTFIQSVTGLGNDVVLAGEGGHCTGVSSFIYNSDHFETRVYLYTETELLDLFNKNLIALQTEYNHAITNPRVLNSFAQIQGFTLTSVGLPENLVGRLAVMKYVGNYGLIRNLLSGMDENGKPIPGLMTDADGHKYISITDPKLVQPWIAQHNGHYASDKDYVAYMNYLAVNRVEIFQNFLCTDAGNIVLMDNVGLGDASNDISTEDHMYQAIADNSDAVILLYQPKPNSGWRGEEMAINERLDKIRFVEGRSGKERMDVHELYFLLNRRCTPGFDNSKDCPEVVKAFREQPYERKESILVANVFDKDSTRKEAVEPILIQLMEHLDDIDVGMVETANALGQSLYSAFNALESAVAKVISGTMKQGSNELKKFRSLYEALDLSAQVRTLEQQYVIDKDKPCPEVRQRIEEVVSGLPRLIGKPDQIMVDIKKGKEATNDILEKYAKQYRNRIYAEFHNINTEVLLPLQNHVTDSIIGLLFYSGKLGNIPLKGYAVEDGPSQLWLKTLMEEKVDCEVYPKLHSLFGFVLNYDLSIEGLLKYNVANCLYTLDPNDNSFKTMNPITGVSDEVHAKKIWSELVNRTTNIQAMMRKWSDEFSLIPSHSFYAQVSMFRDMIVEDQELEQELHAFYAEHRMAVWRDDFSAMVLEEEAFGRWNEESKAITGLCKKNDFVVKLSD